MTTYATAAALLFGSSDFTAREFALRTGCTRAPKVLSELKRRGHVERTGRGRYRCLGPEEHPDLRAADWERARTTILAAGLPFAWDGPSAVEAWTGGGYVVSPSVVTRDFHMVVPRARLRDWEAFLHDHMLRAHARKPIGVRVHLRSVGRMPKIATVGGEPVIPRAEALKLARSSPGVYANAEEWFLDRAG